MDLRGAIGVLTPRIYSGLLLRIQVCEFFSGFGSL